MKSYAPKATVAAIVAGIAIGVGLTLISRKLPSTSYSARNESEYVGDVLAPTGPKTERGGQSAQDSSPPREPVQLDPTQAQRFIEIRTDPYIPAFDLTELVVKKDEIVSLTLRNLSEPSNHPHSFALIEPGHERDVGAIAARLAPGQTELPPEADRYILARTRLIEPGGSETVVFRAPSKPGIYPFICTYPGHWESMKGELRVTE